jgi:hypothetical protein
MEVSLIQKLSDLTSAGKYEQLLDTCEELQLDDQQSREFYVFHFFACYLTNQPHLAKMLWKRVPEKYRDDKPANLELRHTWEVGKALFRRTYLQVYREIDSFGWQTPTVVQEFRRQFVIRMTQLIATAYRTLSIVDAAGLLGLAPEAVSEYSRRQGWQVEGNYVKPNSRSQVAAKEFTHESLENLTKLMTYLERRTSYAK